jgi:hypothetical protein
MHFTASANKETTEAIANITMYGVTSRAIQSFEEFIMTSDRKRASPIMSHLQRAQRP